MGFHGIANMAIDPCGVWGDVEVIVLLSSCRGAGVVFSSPRPPKIFHANPNTIIESLPTFPTPVEDSDSLREDIDIFPSPGDSIPPSIESDDDVVEDIPVDVPNILPTHPTLLMAFDFIPSRNDLGSDLDGSSPSGDRNKIYDNEIKDDQRANTNLF
ncbi:hypothetical protein Tco_0739336 [Tanacetum coccineum]